VYYVKPVAHGEIKLK